MLRPISKKRAKRLAEVREFREAFRRRVHVCEGCCVKYWHCCAVHEIARGCDRQKALDKPYAILLLCDPGCHQTVGSWPRAKQLALLKLRRPADFDLAGYNALVGRQVSAEEVESYWRIWRADDSGGDVAAEGQPSNRTLLDRVAASGGGECGPGEVSAEVLPDRERGADPVLEKSGQL